MADLNSGGQCVMQIKKKIDVQTLLNNFSSIAQWDSQGNKHYLVFEDRTRGGQWTLMSYQNNNQFSVHGQGVSYNDEDELFFEDHEALVSFLWDNRAAYNAVVKKIILAETTETSHAV
jgi:hypothetical protein